MSVRNELRGVAASALVVSLLAAAVIASGVARPVQRLAADALVRAAGERPPAPVAGVPDVALVTIDPVSLRAYPDWPWPRELHARAVDRLSEAGAAAIAFDIDFSSASNPASDAALGDAVERSGRVVLAAFRQVRVLPGGGELEVANVPVPAIGQHAAAIGSVLMPIDPDGRVRRGPRSSLIAGVPRASLAEAALAVAMGRDAAPESGGTLPVDYRRTLPAVPEIPIADVLAGTFPQGDVRGRVVLIGATAAEFQDLWPTPVGPAQPGVWIQAILARTLAAEKAGEPVLRAVPDWGVWVVALLGVAGLAPFARWSGRRRLLVLIAQGGVLCVGSVALLVNAGWLLDPIVPGAALALQHVLGLERVRVRLGRLAAESERSLAAVSNVGLATTTPVGSDPLSLALALLGDVVDARAVALLRADAEGSLDGQRLDWLRQSDAQPAGDLDRALEALASHETRIVEASDHVAVYAPLFAGPVAVGVLVVERAGAGALDPTQLRTIATVGTQVALSAENLRLLDGLRSTFDSAVEAIASAVEARDGYTESHCRRLAIFSVLMADRLGVEPDEIEAIRLGALLHDVGKIGIRDEVLLKPGRFDDAERAEMQSHTILGHKIVLPVHGLAETTAACVRHHHERWDGQGYPDGLAGEEIPLGARIVSVVDVWDALSTARPYKPAYPQEKVIGLLRKGRGTEFDPEVVDLFLQVLDEEGEELLALTRGDDRF